MPHEIKNPVNLVYVIVCNPLTGVFHHGEVEPENWLQSGQPMMLCNEIIDVVYDLVYSSYSDLDDLVPREVLWAVGYSLDETLPLIAALNSILPDVYIGAIKHPLREEYALPWSQYIVDSAPESGTKDVIQDTHAVSLDAGNVKTREQLISDGWEAE